MEEAHAESVMIMGETIASEAPYDFAHQDVTKRIHKLVPVMLEHRFVFFNIIVLSSPFLVYCN